MRKFKFSNSQFRDDKFCFKSSSVFSWNFNRWDNIKVFCQCIEMSNFFNQLVSRCWLLNTDMSVILILLNLIQLLLNCKLKARKLNLWLWTVNVACWLFHRRKLAAENEIRFWFQMKSTNNRNGKFEMKILTENLATIFLASTYLSNW